MSRSELPTLNPASLSLTDAAQLLAKVSGDPITSAMIELDRTAGAPANPDGTLHLIHYAAWLVKQNGEADAH